MKLEYWILGILKMIPMTGYDLKKYLDSEGRFGRARAPLSQIYTTLKRMLDNGWVNFKEEKREGKPDIKIYQNTDVGDQVFLDFLQSPVELVFRYRESEVMYRIMFSYLLKPEVIIGQIQAEIDYRKEQISEFRPRDRSIKSTLLTEGEIAYAQDVYDLLHEYGAKGIDDYVLLLEKSIKLFKNKGD